MVNRICLINPQALNSNLSIPLSLAYLGANLKNHGYIVKVIDASAPYNLMPSNEMLVQLKEFHPSAICITIMTPFSKEAYELIQDLKKLDYFIIAGGAHATILPEEVLQKGADIVVRGEGEDTLIELLAALCKHENLDNVKGISYKKSDDIGSFIHNQDREYIENLDLLPFPDKDLFNPRWYNTDGMPTNEVFGTILTSRGCPGKCIFCSRDVFRNKVRFNSPEYIIDQMLDLKQKYGVDRYYFLDDNFTTDKTRLFNLFELIHNTLPSITWACTSRIDNVNFELLKAMKSSGCTTITYGIESGSNATLKHINKNLTVDKIKNVVKMTYDTGIEVCANWILGFPFESKDDVEETIRLIEFLDPYIVMHNAGFLIPFPGTEIYNQYKYLDSVKEYWLK